MRVRGVWSFLSDSGGQLIRKSFLDQSKFSGETGDGEDLNFGVNFPEPKGWGELAYAMQILLDSLDGDETS